MTRRRTDRVGIVLPHAAVAFVGVAVAVAATAVHRAELFLLGAEVPAGLLLAIGTTYAVAWSLWQVPAPTRLTTTYAAAWVLTLFLLLRGRPEGDYVVAGDTVGYALVVAGVGLVALGVFAARRGSADATDPATRMARRE